MISLKPTKPIFFLALGTQLQHLKLKVQIALGFLLSCD